jgi:hypothetical protein
VNRRTKPQSRRQNLDIAETRIGALRYTRAQSRRLAQLYQTVVTGAGGASGIGLGANGDFRLHVHVVATGKLQATAIVCRRTDAGVLRTETGKELAEIRARRSEMIERPARSSPLLFFLNVQTRDITGHDSPATFAQGLPLRECF